MADIGPLKGKWGSSDQCCRSGCIPILSFPSASIRDKSDHTMGAAAVDFIKVLKSGKNFLPSRNRWYNHTAGEFNS